MTSPERGIPSLCGVAACRCRARVSEAPFGARPLTGLVRLQAATALRVASTHGHNSLVSLPGGPSWDLWQGPQSPACLLAMSRRLIHSLLCVAQYAASTPLSNPLITGHNLDPAAPRRSPLSKALTSPSPPCPLVSDSREGPRDQDRPPLGCGAPCCEGPAVAAPRSARPCRRPPCRLCCP
jgi:hypothetical protein